jgi:hypothetical protein
LKVEKVDTYDLVYFTQNNSEEDKYYYHDLSLTADRAQFIYLKRLKFDILNHVRAYLHVCKEIKNFRYAKVIVSSIDMLAYRRLAFKNSNTTIISFDDGIGHIVKDSDFLTKKNYIRSTAYAAIFGVPTIHNFIKLIVRHYSAYRNFENIMPSTVVKYVDTSEIHGVKSTDLSKIYFFIGSPFEDYHDADYVHNLTKYIKGIKLDYYVRHPRETSPLTNDIPFLNKHGRIAEDAIFKASNEHRPVIVGPFSTVLINISPDFADKIMILRRNVTQDIYYGELGQMAGCEIVYI